MKKHVIKKILIMIKVYIIAILQNTIKEERELFQKQLLEIMNKNCKIHPKKLQKINNGLINNGIINNTYNIIKFGNENIYELLTDKVKFKI